MTTTNSKTAAAAANDNDNNCTTRTEAITMKMVIGTYPKDAMMPTSNPYRDDQGNHVSDDDDDDDDPHPNEHFSSNGS
jgi:hypothetical protein